MRRLIHLIPYDGIGGVEIAAATAEGARRDDFVMERMFIFEDVQDRSGRLGTFDPLTLWTAAGRLKKAQPTLVILSLWRSVLVGGLARLRGCRAPMVLFLHNARDAHGVDRFVTRIAARWVSAIWADSTTTLEQRLPRLDGRPTRVISYTLDRPDPVRAKWPDPTPDLIFWGRITAQKDPIRMLTLFEHVHAARPDATLTIIGPDGGLETALRAEIARRGLNKAVTLTGPLPRDTIRTLAAQASFYLQTSRYEGMALSVIEAMQAGLVPVVTPVGEIARYTTERQNALWVTLSNDTLGGPTDKNIAARIIELIDAPEDWRKLRLAATRALFERPLYAEDVMAAAIETTGTSDPSDTGNGT